MRQWTTVLFAFSLALLTQTGCHINYEKYDETWPQPPAETKDKNTQPSKACTTKTICEKDRYGTLICEEEKVCPKADCTKEKTCYERRKTQDPPAPQKKPETDCQPCDTQP